MKYSSPQVIRTVAQREIAHYMRNKPTLISLAIVAILGIAGIFIGGALASRDNQDTTIGVVDISEAYFDTAAEMTATDQVQMTSYPDTAAAAGALEAEDIAGFLVVTPEGFEYHSPDQPNTDVTVLLETGVSLWAQEQALETLQIPPEQYFSAYPATTITQVDTSGTSENFEKLMPTFIAICIVMFFIITFTATLGSRVTEEKSSHVVSLLVAAVRPVDLLVGKLLGNLIFGTVGTAALLGLFVGAFQLSALSTDLSLPAHAVWLSLLCFVLGMLFFGALYAAAGAMVSRTEDLQSTQTPVLILLIAAGYSATFGITNLDSTFMSVVSWIPPFSIFDAPLQYSAGHFSAAQFWTSYAIAFATTLLILLLSARIYRVGLLHSGTKLRWLQFFSASKNS